MKSKKKKRIENLYKVVVPYLQKLLLYHKYILGGYNEIQGFN